MAMGAGSVDLQVLLTDAQGLRLFRGGEIRLVITLRASDDPEGEAFGAKVTPWLPVPEGEAPQWKARATSFRIPSERCFEAEFVDSAHLHVMLTQKGHVPPPGAPQLQQQQLPAGAQMFQQAGAGGFGLGAVAGAGGGELPAGPLGVFGAAALRFQQQARSAALQGATSVLSTTQNLAQQLGGAAAAGPGERTEVIGVLWIPVGKRLIRAGAEGLNPGAADASTWVELTTGGINGEPKKVKGSLLMELRTAFILPGIPLAPAPPVPASLTMAGAVLQRGQAEEGLRGSPRPPPLAETPARGPGGPGAAGAGCEAPDGSDRSEEADSGAEASDSTSASPTCARPPPPPPEDAATSAKKAAEALRRRRLRDQEELAAMVRSWQEAEQAMISAKAVTELLAEEVQDPSGLRQTQLTEWQPFARGQRQAAAPAGGGAGEAWQQGFNIFTINDRAASSTSTSSAAVAEDGGAGRGGGSASSSSSRPLKSLLGSWSRPKAPRIRPLGQRIRSSFDPNVRKGRQEVRKWRRRHEIFVVLNEIERCLGEACRLLLQASASMRRFEESHGSLRDGQLLSAFLRDAALYFKSEADVPGRLEAHLGDLERVADEFRSVPLVVEGAGGGDPLHPDNQSASGQSVADWSGGGDPATLALRRESADMQVDIAVLLESALMTAQQALAEYKKMHCRLELVATEYEPLCRLEVEMSSNRPLLLPLLVDESSQAASLPEQAVRWAVDFSHMVGPASKGLEALARELERRRRRLATCAGELRDVLLRIASTAPARLVEEEPSL